MTTNKNLPVITVPEGLLKVQTHEKYGDSLVMEGNTLVMNGKLYRVNTFKTFEKVEVNGRMASVTIPHISLREIEGATVPKTVEKPAKQPKKETFATVAKEQDEMQEYKDFLAFKAMKAQAAK